MQTFNIHHAETHLSRLIAKAAKGEAFVIAKAGKPLVKVVPLDAPTPREIPDRIHEGAPDDFDRMHEAEIERMFYGEK
jgi:antitoxin (DNA-binding transcriptional repressor) of toxin-antitoxin stability system